MSNVTRKSESETTPKKQKLAEMSNQDKTVRTVEPVRGIFKLNTDCLNEIFDLLDEEDLLSFGQTCKTMQRVVGDYFKTNCSGCTKFGGNDGIYRVFSDTRIEPAQTSGFNQFIKYISYNSNGLGLLRYIDSHSHEFTSVNHLYLEGVDLSRGRIICLQNILSKLEIIQIRQCSLQCNFYETFLRHCTNVQRLYIQLDVGDIIERDGNEWLDMAYPTLQHLEFYPRKSVKINLEELIGFFKRNPNVQSFSTSSLFLLKNQPEFEESKIQLDTLEIKETGHGFFREFGHLNIRDLRNMFLRDYGNKERRIKSLFLLLNQLYAKGMYKRLHLQMSGLDQKCCDEMMTLKGLEKLCIRFFEKSYGLENFTNLKELALLEVAPTEELETLAKGLVNLQRLYLAKTAYIDIVPFIQHSPNLKRIIIKDAVSIRNGIFNLGRLNRYRAALDGAQKMAIYVPDKMFVALKRATDLGDIDLSMIQLLRSDSYRWDHFYS